MGQDKYRRDKDNTKEAGRRTLRALASGEIDASEAFEESEGQRLRKLKRLYSKSGGDQPRFYKLVQGPPTPRVVPSRPSSPPATSRIPIATPISKTARPSGPAKSMPFNHPGVNSFAIARLCDILTCSRINVEANLRRLVAIQAKRSGRPEPVLYRESIRKLVLLGRPKGREVAIATSYFVKQRARTDD
mgnify:CR=1 FL=1